MACDFKCGFDRDDPRVARLGLPDQLFAADISAFEQEVNQLRTHQGQSDVFVINEQGTILAPTFGGGANSLVTEVLGEAAIISSDFGGNPPYEKMKAVGAICYRHFLKQTNVLFIIGGKSNNTDILETFRGMGDALREHFAATGRRRCTSSSAVAGRTWCAAWETSRKRSNPRAALSVLRLRQRDLGSGELREEGRRVDAGGRARGDRGLARPQGRSGVKGERTMYHGIQGLPY